MPENEDEIMEIAYGRSTGATPEEPKYVIEQDGPKSFRVYVQTEDGMRYQTEYGPWFRRSLKSAEAKGKRVLANYIKKYGGPKRRWEGTL